MTAVDLPAVPRVLIAEADPWSRDLLKQVLLNVRCDARLDLCADGQQAISLLSEVPYDLAIVDWELPGVDGLNVLRSVRQRKRNPPLPFILMSSRNDSASVREAIAAGAHGLPDQTPEHGKPDRASAGFAAQCR